MWYFKEEEGFGKIIRFWWSALFLRFNFGWVSVTEIRVVLKFINDFSWATAAVVVVVVVAGGGAVVLLSCFKRCCCCWRCCFCCCSPNDPAQIRVKEIQSWKNMGEKAKRPRVWVLGWVSEGVKESDLRSMIYALQIEADEGSNKIFCFCSLSAAWKDSHQTSYDLHKKCFSNFFWICSFNRTSNRH